MDAASELTHAVLDGRYRLTRLLGEGGMGQVYEGIHQQLARKIAVKVLLPRYACDAKYRERFLREARATSTVRHPNIVQMLDFGDTPNGSVYFAMEFLEGRDLASLLRDDGILPWPRARHLLLQMMSALGAAHQHNIVHRDVKPGNFFIIDAFGHKEFIKVLDFGIAKIMAGPDDGDRTQAQDLTGTGEIFGTAKYMAPEQAFGESNDPRVDIYSLGVVAYQMLTSDVPFTGGSAYEIITRHVNDPPRAPRTHNPAIPPAAEQVILRALAKRPEDRFSSMDEMWLALSKIPAAEDETPYIPPRSPGFPGALFKERSLGAQPKPIAPPPEDSDSLRLEGFSPIKLGGTPMGLPMPINPFKSVTGGGASSQSSARSLDDVRSDSTATVAGVHAFGSFVGQETTPGFGVSDQPGYEALRERGGSGVRPHPSSVPVPMYAESSAPVASAGHAAVGQNTEASHPGWFSPGASSPSHPGGSQAGGSQPYPVVPDVPVARHGTPSGGWEHSAPGMGSGMGMEPAPQPVQPRSNRVLVVMVVALLMVTITAVVAVIILAQR